MTLRGHAYYVECVGTRGGGWGPWIVAVAVAGLAVAEVWSRVHP